MAASSSHPAAETVTNSILRASLVVKIVGFSVANAAAQTKLGQRLGFASLLSSRSSLASLQLYTLDDGVGTILSEIAIAAIENVILRYSSPSLALGALVSDAMLAAPFSRLLRVVASPWPRLDSTEAAHVARQLQRSEIHAVVAAQALRAFIRSSVYLTRRYLQGNTYLRPQAVICQTIATTVDAAFVSYVALVGTSKLLQNSRFASRFSVWAVVYGGLWTLGCGLSAFVTQKLNRLAQPFIARCLYHKLPGPKNPLQRLFDIRQLNVQFGHLTANELTELSKFANEALRSAAINQNTRLHAVRYLASLTAYVKAVNNGTLDRTVAKRRHAETASPFVRHVFTDEYLAHCHVIGSAPHACVSCQKEFVANEHAECLRCGHQVHTSDHRVPPGQRPCNDLISDWCPACVCPIHATNNEQHRKIYVQMRHYVDSLAAEWQTCQIIPTSLNNSEWGLVAQYARRHQVVEGEVPLDVIPSDQQPGQLALFDLVLASVVWALRFAPIEPNPHMFVLLNGW